MYVLNLNKIMKSPIPKHKSRLDYVNLQQPLKPYSVIISDGTREILPIYVPIAKFLNQILELNVTNLEELYPKIDTFVEKLLEDNVIKLHKDRYTE
jgi:hypothetical protein